MDITIPATPPPPIPDLPPPPLSPALDLLLPPDLWLPPLTGGVPGGGGGAGPELHELPPVLLRAS